MSHQLIYLNPKIEKEEYYFKENKIKTSEQKQIETKQLEPTKRKFEEPNTSPLDFRFFEEFTEETKETF